MKKSNKKESKQTAEKKGTTKKASKQEQSKTANQQGSQQPKQQQQQAKNEEEKKDQAKVSEQAVPVREIKLAQLVDSVEAVTKKNKTAFVLDPTGNSFTFYKYKGTIIDISEYSMLEQMQKQTRADSQEKARKQLHYTLKSGSTGVFFFDQMPKNMAEFFKEAQFYKPESLFVPEQLLKEEYYKKHLIKPEEDVDFEGNKGCFYAKKDSQICILISIDTQDYAALFNQLGVKSQYFEIIKILP